MDSGTGKLYESREDALKKFEKLLDKDAYEKKKNDLIPLNPKEFGKLKGMNRAQRRQWARENRR